MIADGLGPNEPGGPIPPWRGRVVLISGAAGGELLTIYNPEATADSIFGLGVAPIPDQDADRMPDILVGGMRITPAPTAENPSATTSEWMWWVISTATTEPIRMGSGAVGGEFLMPGETPRQFWASNEAAGEIEILPGIAGDLDGDGDVDAGDAAALIGEWATGTPGSARVGDLNGNSLVNAADLSILLSQIGFPPSLGRWSRMDPRGFVGRMSAYAYAMGSGRPPRQQDLADDEGGGDPGPCILLPGLPCITDACNFVIDADNPSPPCSPGQNVHNYHIRHSDSTVVSFSSLLNNPPHRAIHRSGVCGGAPRLRRRAGSTQDR